MTGRGKNILPFFVNSCSYEHKFITFVFPKDKKSMSPRPKRSRRLAEPPTVSGFVPESGDYDPDNPIVLHFEEYEAIRLADYENLSQQLASEKMQVSRPTFTRIYDSARKKVALAFVEHKRIRISGGHVSFDYEWFACYNCGIVYRKDCVKKIENKVCPLCSSSLVVPVEAKADYKREIGLTVVSDCHYKPEANKKAYCICPKCNLRIEHKQGIPCANSLCPECNIRMMRENSINHQIVINKKKKPMKKLAIPVSEGQLAEHFGHTRLFQFYEIEKDTILTSYTKEPPPHKEGALPRWLAEEKVTDLLVGGIGPKAIKILDQHEICVFKNTEVAAVECLANDFISGDLKTGQHHCHH